MTCNLKDIPIFSVEQIKECQDCRHASAKKVWCCRLGVAIPQIVGDGMSIIVPDKRLIKPAYPPVSKMAVGFLKAAGRHAADGFKTRGKAEQEQFKAICKGCPDYVPDTIIGDRCRRCGCRLDTKINWETAHCPAGKW